MKKRYLVFIVLLLSMMIFISSVVGWVNFPDQRIHYAILLLSFFIPLSLLLPLIFKTKLSKNQKLYWCIYVVLTSFIGGIHFYISNKNEIELTLIRTNQKMIEGPDSLSEFDSSSDR